MMLIFCVWALFTITGTVITAILLAIILKRIATENEHRDCGATGGCSFVDVHYCYNALWFDTSGASVKVRTVERFCMCGNNTIQLSHTPIDDVLLSTLNECGDVIDTFIIKKPSC